MCHSVFLAALGSSLSLLSQLIKTLYERFDNEPLVIWHLDLRVLGDTPR